MSQGKYGEPWVKRLNHPDTNSISIFDVYGNQLCKFNINDEKYVDRVVSCVNLVGDRDPAECVVFDQEDIADYFKRFEQEKAILESENALLKERLAKVGELLISIKAKYSVFDDFTTECLALVNIKGFLAILREKEIET